MAVNGPFGFTYPWVLSALVILIPLVLYDIINGLGNPRQVGSASGRERRLSGELRKKLLISVIFFRVFIVCIIIALAGPYWGLSSVQAENRRGLDAVFAVDVSRSMDIRDMQSINSGESSRLERGLAIAMETAAAFPGPRYAAAVGKGSGILAIPLTWDSEVIFNFLESLDGSSVTGRGTNLESLLAAAAGAFQNSSVARRAIVLISDGEALSGNLKNTLDRCKREGIAVLALALGSDEGRPVPDYPLLSGTVSRRDASAMRLAAGTTGGSYIDGNRDDAAVILSSILRSLVPGASGYENRPEPKERRFLFVIIAIAAYIASKFSPMITGRKK